MKKIIWKLMVLNFVIVIGMSNLDIQVNANVEKRKADLQQYDDSKISSFDEFLKLGIQVKEEKEIKRELMAKSKINIITKNLTWNGSLDLSNNPKKIVMHHIEASKTDGNFKVEEINEWHKSNGWSGIGYHFYINKKGEIYRGRPEEAIGAHALNNNVDTLGIAVEGKYNTETMNNAQKEAVILLGKYIRQKYGIEVINKHKDLVPTSCPGKNYPFENVKQEISKEKLLDTKIYEWREEEKKIFLIDNWMNTKVEGKIEYKGKIYEVNKTKGIVNKGWYMIDDRELYISSDNRYATGWEKINDIWYYFNEKGKMQIGWIYLNGEWYYLNINGQMQTGWYFDGVNWYLLNGSGKMQTGWYFDGINWYLLNDSGKMETGWYFDGINWYLLNSSGKMQTGWYFDGKEWYIMKENGIMQRGWYFDKKWYYLDYSGKMKKEWQFIDNNWYYFYSNGIMASNEIIDGWKIEDNGIATKIKSIV